MGDLGRDKVGLHHTGMRGAHSECVGHTANALWRGKAMSCEGYWVNIFNPFTE